MSKINYKPEQATVIACENKNQLVSASAGSGKTTIMIQKIINLITKDKINIKDILVLTYTKASAEEMKQKLVSAIYEEVKNDKSLVKQIDDIETSDISTIHSFFQKIIKKYFMMLNINPNFELIDEVSGAKLKNQAMDKAIEAFSENNPQAFQELLEVFGSTRNTKKLKGLVFKLYQFLLAVPNKADWVQNVATKLYESVDNNPAIEILNNDLYFAAQHFIKVFKALQQQSVNFDEPDYVEYINEYLAALECVKKTPENFFVNASIFQNFSTKKPLSKKEDVMDLYNKIHSTKTDFKKTIDKVKEWSFTDEIELSKSLKKSKILVKSLCELTSVYEKTYFALKTEHNVLDYDDLEKYMLVLIENNDVKLALQNHYHKIFVDEYQDANRVQEKIIKAISKPNNRFMVGDVKQSIYGFRQAEPDIFLETLQEFSNNAVSEVGFLNYNFRSHKLILNFVNLVFSKIMNITTSKIDYSATSMFKWDEVYKDIENQHVPTVEIDIIQKPGKEKKPEPTKMYSVLDKADEKIEYSNAQLEAFFVAKRISELLGKKIYVAKEKRERIIDYKDITILLRGRGTYLDEFCAVITGLGIPLYANTSNSLYDDGDILVLLNVLRLAVNPKNDIALVSVMHSPFGNFTFSDLAKIRLASENNTSFYDAVMAYTENDEVYKKIQTLKEFLEAFEFNVEQLGIFKAYTEIITNSGFENFVLAKEDGIEKLEKIKKYVNSFLTNGYNHSAIEFLEFVENNSQNILAPDYTGGANCVSITTIHSSKGLEYPVVIMANAGQNFDISPEKEEFVVNQQLGLGLKDYNLETRQVSLSLAFTAIKKANKNNDFAEKLRLLYVALTRPQNHLIVVGTNIKPFSQITSDFQTLNQKSYLSLLVNSLSQEEIEKINNGENFETENYAVNVICGLSEPNFMNVNEITSQDVDNAALEEMKQYFDFNLEKTPEVQKTSVTALRQQFDNKTQTQALGAIDNIVDIGNAYHKVMEEIDFMAINSLSDVEKFILDSSIENVNLVNKEKIFNAITQIKSLNAQVFIKERPFVLYDNLSKSIKGLEDNETCVRGVIDLIALGKHNYLIDYKYTTETNVEKIVEKYAIQLDVYQKACSLAGIKVDKKYLLLLNSGELIEI